MFLVYIKPKMDLAVPFCFPVLHQTTAESSVLCQTTDYFNPPNFVQKFFLQLYD